MAKDIIPSHALAAWLIGIIDRLLDACGLQRYRDVEAVLYIVIVVAVAFAVGWVTRRLVILVARRFVSQKQGGVGSDMLSQHTLTKCSHVVPPMVLMGLLPFAFEAGNRVLGVIERIASVYMLVAFGVCAVAILNLCFTRYNERANTRNLPIKGILNIAKGAVWIIVLIVGVSIVADKSPAVLLTGLGAFAAALLLIFKDSILGFVAGLQMSQNDMLHVGDWIEVPSTEANGIVIDVSLTAVKVRNLDNTIVTVPPYTLVSTSFRNYRGMYDSGVRRIMQELLVDPQTVTVCDDAMRARLVPSASGDDEGAASAATNLALYRLHMMDYLRRRDDIAREQRLMVSVVHESASGLAVQIYCFSVHTDWNRYELVQSEVLEYAMAAAAGFGLRIVNRADLGIRQ
jgi:miniconductance mechanosensitive channel